MKPLTTWTPDEEQMERLCICWGAVERAWPWAKGMALALAAGWALAGVWSCVL